MENRGCRFCSETSGELVLDLGNQPACDHFPAGGDPRTDPRYPLEMWLCSSCGLAQLVGEPTLAEEPLGVEPRALVSQAADAVARLSRSGWLSGRRRVVEFSSPHGGSWLDLLAARHVMPVDEGPADVVVDSFGMMHDADQSAAVAERTARVAPGGVLLLQYHSLETILRLGQWNALRHGHFAYYSTSALIGMLEANGFYPRMAWSFDLYGGTVLLAACRERELRAKLDDSSVANLLSRDVMGGVRDPVRVGRLQDQVESHAMGLREWLLVQRAHDNSVLGYGAASRAVALLCRAEADHHLLPAIVDSSESKHGRRMPGTDIPIVGPSALTTKPPRNALLLIPDLLAEVKAGYPEVEAAGGRWIDAEALRATVRSVDSAR